MPHNPCIIERGQEQQEERPRISSNRWNKLVYDLRFLQQNMFVRPVSFAKHHKEMQGSLLLPFPHFNRAVSLLVPFIFTNSNHVIKE